MRNISLGIHMGHDRSVSVVADGVLIGSLATERIDRVKHSISSKVPFDTIDALLKYLKIDIYSIKYVGITYAAVEIRNLERYYYDQLKNYYPDWNFKLIPVSHHLAHAASAYYTSEFDRALVFVADGGGDLVNGEEEAESVYIASKEGLHLVEQRLQSNVVHTLTREQFHLYPFMNDKYKSEQVSIAKKYEQITYAIGFEWNQAGKTMGLASYGKELFPIDLPPINSLQYDLSLEFLTKEIYQLYLKSGLKYPFYINEYKKDIARTVQIFTEKLVISIIKYLLDKYEIKEICLAGGLFLNCLLNHKILEKLPDVTLHICPAAGDDGQSIGAAFIAYQYFADQKKHRKKTIPYLGLSYDNHEILNAIKSHGLDYKFYREQKQLYSIVAQEIYSSKIIGFFTGRSEIGPRALCHRSLLANATWDGMKDYLNNKVKHRENFRPFAPVILEEFEMDYFKLKQTSPYMLLAPEKNDRYIVSIPSVVHVDKTARVQSVNANNNPYIYGILQEFYKLSGTPVVLNTSFNDNGEPIVESPDDAINTFLSTQIDVLVLENFIIYK